MMVTLASQICWNLCFLLSLQHLAWALRSSSSCYLSLLANLYGMRIHRWYLCLPTEPRGTLIYSGKIFTGNCAFATCTSFIMHLICPSPPLPKKFCISFVLISLGTAVIPWRNKKKLEGVGGGANKVHYGRFASGECSINRCSRIAIKYLSVQSLYSHVYKTDTWYWSLPYRF